jgi:hypothetical protein
VRRALTTLALLAGAFAIALLQAWLAACESF